MDFALRIVFLDSNCKLTGSPHIFDSQQVSLANKKIDYLEQQATYRKYSVFYGINSIENRKQNLNI